MKMARLRYAFIFQIASFLIMMLPFSPANAQGTMFLSDHSNMCIDAEGGVRQGARLIVWDCHGGDNQRFTLSNGRLMLGSFCVDAASGMGRNGDDIILWPCHGGANQRWELKRPRRDMGAQIVGVNGRCIDIYRGDSSRGAVLKLWDCHGGRNQAWATGSRLGWAYVFMRPNMPYVAGHAGWGFQLPDGRYLAGAVDGTGTNPYISPDDDKTFHWMEEFSTESGMKDKFRLWGSGMEHAQYTHYKKIAVLDPSVSNGRAKAQSYMNSGYRVVMKNCMDETYHVLISYGVASSTLPWPSTNWFPNVWFWNINIPQISMY